MGHSGYGPFDNDQAHDWFCLVEKEIRRPLVAAAKGHEREYASAYAAIWVALGIERQEPQLFGEEILPPSPALAAKRRALLKKNHSKARFVKPRPDFWKLAQAAIDRMALDQNHLESFSHPTVARAAYRALRAEVRAVHHHHAFLAEKREETEGSLPRVLGLDGLSVDAAGGRKKKRAPPRAKGSPRGGITTILEARAGAVVEKCRYCGFNTTSHNLQCDHGKPTTPSALRAR